MRERWKAIPGWVGFYEASNLGRIRSLTRKVWVQKSYRGPIFRIYRSKILTPGISNYPVVQLVRGPRKKYYYVHQLVLLTFEGPPPVGFEVCHNNGCKMDNKLSNLRYDTRRNNSLDRKRHGTNRSPSICGVNNRGAKLSLRDVNWIKKNKNKYSQREMGVKLGVSHSRIGAVLRGESYI